MNLAGKKVLVTGADGFIGSHLVEHLVEKGARVRAFCYYNSFNSWGWLDSLSKEKLGALEIFTGDVRDPGSVNLAMKDVEVVFHLAALVGIPYSYQSPESYLATNISGTLNILQAARSYETTRVIITSTSEVYGTARYVPIDEGHPRQGQSPYAATKIGADAVAESFYQSFGTPVTIARPFNTFGPRQSSRAVIPAIITQLIAAQKEIMLGETASTRDFIFVKDTVSAFIRIAETDTLIGEDVNIATGTEISIGALAQEIINLISPATKIITDPDRKRPPNSEVFRLLGSAEKFKKHTGWQPLYTLQQGLVETIDWFNKSDNLKKYKAGMYNV